MSGKKSCAAFGCTSNSGTKTEYCPVFSFPYVPNPHDHRPTLHILKIDPVDNEKIKELKLLTKKWVLALPNDPKTLVINKYNGICIKHFYPHEINVFIGPKQTKRKLTYGSIPSVFTHNSQQNLRTLRKSKMINDYEKDLDHALKISKQTFQEENSICSFEKLIDIVKKFESPLIDEVTVKITNTWVSFITIDYDNFSVENYLKINDDLSYEVSFDPSFYCKAINSRKTLIELIKCLKECPCSAKVLKSKIINTLARLNTCKRDSLKILIEDQISNIGRAPECRWYNPSALLIYLKSFLYSPKLYRLFRDNNILIMPHERNLRRIISEFSVDNTMCDNNKNYINYKISKLKPI